MMVYFEVLLKKSINFDTSRIFDKFWRTATMKSSQNFNSVWCNPVNNKVGAKNDIPVFFRFSL